MDNRTAVLAPASRAGTPIRVRRRHAGAVKAGWDGVLHIFGNLVHLLLEAHADTQRHIFAEFVSEQRGWGFDAKETLDFVHNPAEEAGDFFPKPCPGVGNALPQPLDKIQPSLGQFWDKANDGRYDAGHNFGNGFGDSRKRC